jgi:hypothetical protein
MPWVEFEITIPASERVKTVHVLDRAATVFGVTLYGVSKIVDYNTKTPVLIAGSSV